MKLLIKSKVIRVAAVAVAVLTAVVLTPWSIAGASTPDHTASTAVSGPSSVPPPDPDPNPACKSPRTVSTPIGNRTAYLCTTWTKAPVENWTVGPMGEEVNVGYLVGTGFSNWFICQTPSYNLALTEADNGKWGAVGG